MSDKERERRMRIIAVLWTGCFFALWISYECWRFGSFLGRGSCNSGHAIILAIVSAVCCVAGLWLAKDITYYP